MKLNEETRWQSQKFAQPKLTELVSVCVELFTYDVSKPSTRYLRSPTETLHPINNNTEHRLVMKVQDRTIAAYCLKSNVYAFRFFDKHEKMLGDRVIKKRRVNLSATTFIGGEILSKEVVLADQQLTKGRFEHVRSMPTADVVRTKFGFFNPFYPGDQIL